MTKKLLGILIVGFLLVGCAINQTALNVGTDYSDYEKECRKVALVKPKLVFSDGNLRGFHCADGAGADIWRYEFFDTSNKLVKVWSRPVSAQERQARFNNALLGLAIFSIEFCFRDASYEIPVISNDILGNLTANCFC